MSKKELKVKTRGDLEGALKHLRDITNSLKEKKIVIQKEDSFIALTPKKEVMVEIQGEQKRDKESISIKLSWKTEELLSNTSASTLTISSKEPKIKTPAPASQKSATSSKPLISKSKENVLKK